MSALEAVLDSHVGKHVIGTRGNLLTLVLNHYDDRFDFAFWRDTLPTPDCYRVEFVDGELRTSDRVSTNPP